MKAKIIKVIAIVIMAFSALPGMAQWKIGIEGGVVHNTMAFVMRASESSPTSKHCSMPRSFPKAMTPISIELLNSFTQENNLYSEN